MRRKVRQPPGILLLIILLFFLNGCGGDKTPKTFSLSVTVEPEEGGTVTPDGGKFQVGTVVTLEVTPAQGFKFSEWAGTHGNQVTEDNDTGLWELAMTGNKQITAVFIEEGGEGSEFAGGAGTEEDPFLVATAGQLHNVRNFMDKHFKQIADINLSGYTGDEGWAPIGIYLVDPFLGTYDGNGYKITNLVINAPEKSCQGLFGEARGAVLKNITLEGIDINGSSYVGGLVGMADSDTVITNAAGLCRFSVFFSLQVVFNFDVVRE